MKKTLKEKRSQVIALIHKLRKLTKGMELPAADKIVQRYGRDPYLLLISCILSLRTRDTVSYAASCRLFEEADNPKNMLKLPISKIEKLIYPVGFYKTKAKNIHQMSKKLLEDYGGKVPKTLEELMSFKGVGLKTANLVLSMAFHIPALVVDTHVHRIANLLRLVHTKTPEKTEKQLQLIVPKKYWIEFSKLMVQYGQNAPRKDTLKNLSAA